MTESESLPILHHEAGLVVVDKPAGVLVVPAPGRSGRTLVDRVAQQLGTKAFAVHRLDEDTTGAIVVALDDEVRVAMESLFRAHAVQRDYLALLSSAPSPAAGRIEAALEVGGDGIVRVAKVGGQRAITHYATLGRRDRCTLVRCRLETGRRNQIRAHMAALGSPLAGDRKYGWRARAGESFPRVMLHSWRLQFRHPGTGTEVQVEVIPAEPALRP
ncbi:MAG: RNA pseudouridine synthase [Planctomycetes bacterium]|nr:RNA pseudouridine synthase [Planctomycetota bacterium]